MTRGKRETYLLAANVTRPSAKPRNMLQELQERKMVVCFSAGDAMFRHCECLHESETFTLSRGTFTAVKASPPRHECPRTALSLVSHSRQIPGPASMPGGTSKRGIDTSTPPERHAEAKERPARSDATRTRLATGGLIAPETNGDAETTSRAKFGR